VQDKNFRPFFTTKDVGEGLGLGLSNVIDRAGRSGGQIRVQTEHGNLLISGISLYPAQSILQP